MVWAPKPIATPITLAPAINGPISTPSADSAIIAATTTTTTNSTLRKIGNSVCSRARRRASSEFGEPSSLVSASLVSIAALAICQVKSAISAMATALNAPRVRRVIIVSCAVRRSRSMPQPQASTASAAIIITTLKPRSKATVNRFDPAPGNAVGDRPEDDNREQPERRHRAGNPQPPQHDKSEGQQCIQFDPAHMPGLAGIAAFGPGVFRRPAPNGFEQQRQPQKAKHRPDHINRRRRDPECLLDAAGDQPEYEPADQDF